MLGVVKTLVVAPAEMAETRDATAGAAAPCAQVKPAVQGFDVAVALPAAAQKPAAHRFVPPDGATAEPAGQK
jgi:hypothetical protein